jgi:uncharacterized membrane-anchored protein
MLGKFGRLLTMSSLMCVCGLVGVLQAGPQKPIDEATFRRLTRNGPFSVDIAGKASFRVPTGYRMVTEDKLEEFSEAAALPLMGDEAGFIALADRPLWFASIIVVAEDPLKGLDPKTLADPAVRLKLLDWQHQFQDVRRPRKGRSSVPTKVSAWTHPPRYDEKTKVLTMGVRLEAENESQRDKVNYQSFVYGPGGAIILISAIVDVEQFDKAEKEAGKLAGEFTFNPALEAATGDAPAEDSMFIPKVVGGGLVGAIGVLVVFRFLLNGGGKTTSRPARRPVAR